MKTLSIEMVLRLHDKITYSTGGSSGIRDRGLLESALNNAFQTFGGQDLYPSTIDKISVITYSIVNNHPMIDGNKRLGIMVMWMLLKLNNISITYTQDELIVLGLGIAQNQFKENDIRNWIEEHMN